MEGCQWQLAGSLLKILKYLKYLKYLFKNPIFLNRPLLHYLYAHNPVFLTCPLLRLPFVGGPVFLTCPLFRQLFADRPYSPSPLHHHIFYGGCLFLFILFSVKKIITFRLHHPRIKRPKAAQISSYNK